MCEVRAGKKLICTLCGAIVYSSDPLVYYDKGVMCLECGYREQIISEKFFLDNNGIFIDNCHVGIHPETNKVIIWIGSKTPPWGQSNKQLRNTSSYISWRIAVFKRDNYTCQVCGKVGGTLNAHHIKSFALHKKLRLDVNNGITLCEKCHKEVHKKEKING